MSETEQQEGLGSIYASVDLELSGFDVLEDEIIEIGIARFTIKDGKFVVIDTFQSLVRPSSTIRSRVLGLTGINEAEAQQAPSWEEVRVRVVELLASATIIGHGVDLDVKFLEAKGVSCRAQTIDTLELSQIFLPTHHSYNLENLAYELGVTHASAHRALDDALATLGVLEALCGIFNNLPERTRERLGVITRARELVWGQLFFSAFRVEMPRFAVKIESSVPVTVPNIEVLRTSVPAWVLALGERSRVLELASAVGVDAYLGAFESVAPGAVSQLEDSVDSLDQKALLALCKVLVWQAESPKFGILAELNWSIIGTEQKKMFSAGSMSYPPRHVVMTDFRSLFDFREKRNVWIESLDQFAYFLEQKGSFQLTWHGLIGLLRQVYNQDTGRGEEQYVDAVAQAVGHTDAYFGSVLLLLRKELARAEGAVSFDDMGLYVTRRVAEGAKSLAVRIEQLLPGHSREGNMLRALDMLRTFFSGPHGAQVLWVEYGDGRCAFVSRPLDLAFQAKPLFTQHEAIQFQTDIPSVELRSYFLRRLGVSPEDKRMLDIRDFKISKIQCEIIDGSLHKEVTTRLSGLTSAIVLFPTVEQLKRYYDDSFGSLTVPSSVVAVGIHGGAQKVLRNFSHNSKTVVLAAVPQLIGYGLSLPIFARVLYVGSPKVDTAHPFTKQVALDYFSNERECEKYLILLTFLQSLRPFTAAQDVTVEILTSEAEVEIAKFLVASVS